MLRRATVAPLPVIVVADAIRGGPSESARKPLRQISKEPRPHDEETNEKRNRGRTKAGENASFNQEANEEGGEQNHR